MNSLLNRACLGAFALSLLTAAPSFAADVKDVLKSGAKRTDESAKRQDTVDGLATETDKMFREYSRLLKENDTLRTYISLKEREVQRQQEAITKTKDEINQISRVVREVAPLMQKMTTALSTFIDSDIPFLIEDRRERINKLRDVLDRPEISEAEKFRKVLEAYQIELEFGNTIEAYQGDFRTVADGPEERVNYLRIGRVALVVQSFDKSRSYMWNVKDKVWQSVSSAVYSRAFKDGIRIASKQASPDLLIAPIALTSDATQ